VSNRVHAFKDRDVKRLVKAARAAGLTPTAIEVDTKSGKIKVMSGIAIEPNAASNEWDEVCDDGEAKTAIHK
jgi:hypothetical protein